MLGWLTEHEGAALSLLAKGRTVLEVGSYCGRSTVCLAQTAKHVFALDWHRGDDGTRAAGGHEGTLAAFLETLTRYGVDEVVTPLVGRTADLAIALGSGWADLAFIDGAHDETSVSADLRLARRCLKPDGILALHDWPLPGVRAACRAVLGWEPGDGGGTTVDTLHCRRLT